MTGNAELNVSIGMNLQDGPWGGGNQFGHGLAEYLRTKNANVRFDLEVPNLDIILLTEPRAELHISAYTDKEIRRYLWWNRNALVVHRINECDERKNTTSVNALLHEANSVADHTVFVSSWLSDLHVKHGIPAQSHSVILNGSDTRVFNPNGYRQWNGKEPLRLVTHHWGASWQKGFDIYTQLDELLSKSSFRDKYDFTYIGRLPEGFQFHHAKYVEPMHSHKLAAELRQHHVYVTGSINEPGSNHQNEGALCGLPLLYINNASMPEYCTGFGISFESHNFEEKLEDMRRTYSKWISRMHLYPHTMQRVTEAYFDLFIQLINKRDDIVENRQLQRLSWIDKLRTFMKFGS